MQPLETVALPRAACRAATIDLAEEQLERQVVRRSTSQNRWVAFFRGPQCGRDGAGSWYLAANC